MGRTFLILGSIGLASAAFLAVLVSSSDAAAATVLSLQAQLAADLSIPYRVRRWAAQVAAAARATTPPGLNTLTWARAILFVMDRESEGGDLLSPPGPGGTGDGGHGHGLMQIDDGTFSDWLATNDWMDPATNILKGAQVLEANYRYFAHRNYGYPTLLLAFAGYNAGPGTVANAVLAGNDPDSVTAHNDYASSVYNAAFGTKTPAAV